MDLKPALFPFKMTIPEARKILYYIPPEELEYGVVRVRPEIRDWLNEHMKVWDHTWLPTTPLPDELITFFFPTEEDAIAFKLRWL